MRRIIPVIVGVLSIAACHNMPKDTTSGGDLASVIVFANQSTDEAAVYAELPGAPATRIGTVLAGRTDTLTVPATVSGSGKTLRLVARLLAKSATPETGPLTLQRGEWLQVTLPPDEKTLVVLPVRP